MSDFIERNFRVRSSLRAWCVCRPTIRRAIARGMVRPRRFEGWLQGRAPSGAGGARQEHGMVSDQSGIRERRRGKGATIALNAHGDVVPPGQGWSTIPTARSNRAARSAGRGGGVEVGFRELCLRCWR
jgi:acetylornithine deacetylase/succinyl-diaminopimelate desuccinylase-like protein